MTSSALATTSTGGAWRASVQATCHRASRPFEMGTWGALGLGAVLALMGWTALREASAPIDRGTTGSGTPRSTPSA